MCFLADQFFNLANCQKKFQSDRLTVVCIKPELSKFTNQPILLQQTEITA